MALSEDELFAGCVSETFSVDIVVLSGLVLQRYVYIAVIVIITSYCKEPEE